jgi:SAM-dependent methyltransferase
VTREWFEAAAAGYQDASSRWPWSWLRAWEARSVDHALESVEGERVLELGCGAGFYTRRLIAGGAARVVAVDQAPAMVAALPKAAVGVVADARTLDLPEPFDVVLCAGMLEFVDDPGPALRAAARHIRPGGRCVLLAPGSGPAAQVYRWWHERHGVAVRLYAPGELAERARKVGWTLVGEAAVAPLNRVVLLRWGA